MKKRLLLLAKKNNIDIEILEGVANETSIEVLNDQLKEFDISNLKGYSIKAIKNDKTVRMHTENINDPQKIVNEINLLFEVQENSNKNKLVNDNIKNIAEPNKVNYSQAKQDLLSLNDLHKKDKRLKDFQIGYNHHYGRDLIYNENSEMIDYSDYQSFGASISAEEDGITKEVSVSYLSKTYDFKSFKKLFETKIDEVLFKLNSSSIKTNKYNIIIRNDVVSDLLSTFYSMFNAKSIYMHQSLLEDKLNTKVFSEKLNIIEDPLNDNFIGHSLFDAEGTKKQYNEVIKNGVFKKKLNNIEYALKYNEETTGNSGDITNMHIVPGKLDFSSLIKSMKNGIIITSLQGLHSGINKKTGDISLQAEGILVKDGKNIKALSMILLSTNIMELFNNIVEIGSDLLFERTSFGAPSILFKDITITGKE